MEVRNALPDHVVPDEVQHRPRLGTIIIRGRVAHALTLNATEVGRLTRISLPEPFTCEEGWTVPGLTWSGFALADVLALAQPLEDAAYVQVSSDNYSVNVALTDTPDILLCDALDGRPLTLEHGGPWRLVIRGGQCFTSVKWVDRLEVTTNAETGTAEAIARNRLR